MNASLQMLGVVSLAIGLGLGCSDGYTAPVIGAGCGEDRQSAVVLEGDGRATIVFITREYTQVGIVSNRTTTTYYRTCQSHTCWEAREDPAAPLGEAEAAAALARCPAAADAAWAAEHPT
jgi:hypothetical protein